MNIGPIVSSILGAIDRYQKFLDEVSEPDFMQSPGSGRWSYSEVYSHIIYANLKSLLAVQKCIYSKSALSGQPSLLGRAILFFGRFPPVQIKAPEQMALKVRKISREEARNELIKLKRKLEEVSPGVKNCPESNKVTHPRLGMFNAQQWLRFVEIHSWHHLKQLNRISKMLGQSKKLLV